jgi:hypothetical protein
MLFLFYFVFHSVLGLKLEPFRKSLFYLFFCGGTVVLKNLGKKFDV